MYVHIYVFSFVSNTVVKKVGRRGKWSVIEMLHLLSGWPILFVQEDKYVMSNK